MRFIRAETDRVVIESFIRDCDKVEFALAANDEAAAKKWAVLPFSFDMWRSLK